MALSQHGVRRVCVRYPKLYVAHIGTSRHHITGTLQLIVKSTIRSEPTAPCVATRIAMKPFKRSNAYTTVKDYQVHSGT